MTKRRPSILIAVVVLALVAATVGLVVWQSMQSSTASTGVQYRALISRAKRLAAQGKALEVEALCREAIGVDPERPDAYLLAAECARSRADVAQALQDLSHVAKRNSQQWLSGVMLKADILHYDAARLQKAEQTYRQILAIDRDNVFANSGYARLLGLCGRRREAIPLVLNLIRQQAAGDLLVLLSREEAAISDPELIERAAVANPDSAHAWLAKANVAILSLDHDESIRLLTMAIRKQSSAYSIGRLGRQLLFANRLDDLHAWAKALPASSGWAAETWLVMGQMAEQRSDIEGAIRCYWEALQRWPESLVVTSRISTCLQLLGRSDDADVFRKRVASLTRLGDAQKIAIMSPSPNTTADLLELIQAYAECGRLAEAFGWGQAAVQNFSDAGDLQDEFNRVQQQLVGPLDSLTDASFNPATRFDYSEFAIPRGIRTVQKDGTQAPAGSIRFQRQTSDVGFDFTYFNGCGPRSHRTFGFTGGGLGVFDLDSDELPDLICTQAVAWVEDVSPLDGQAQAGDTVFRNRGGLKFQALATGLALPEEHDFGQGVAVGDINDDGFQDLYVANAKANRLWINNGDGTFSASENVARSGTADPDVPGSDALGSDVPNSDVAGLDVAWTTSCLIADVNGDSYADLYDVNYLSGDDVFTRICQQQDGQKIMCGPEAFDGAADRILLNDGQGNFVDATKQFLQPAPKGKGLGIVAFAQDDGRLNLFVANDTVANHFFVPVGSSDAQSTAAGASTFGTPAGGSVAVSMMKDEALVRGVAVNADGKSEACMGIAVSDIDDDQRLDIVVTNFLHETNTLYHSITENLYQDQTRSLGLREGTLPILSFGTQFLDANNDGLQELFFGNGYTQDLPGGEIPYAMQSQLFQWAGDQFQQLPADSIGKWGSQKFVARSVARLDWNADGLADLAVGLLHEPSFLLTNQSKESGETGLTLKLVATRSARDAIGTTVTASVCEKIQTAQLTAGDGYQCSNQRIVWLSGRRQTQIPTITVRWPSGMEQTFADTPASGHWAAVEGRPQLTPMSRKTD